MQKKKLPVGIDDFGKFRREDFYYIDKTGIIRDLLNNWGEVNLFTRPRRFGKTLNMTMLKCFLRLGRTRHCLMAWKFHRRRRCVKNIWESSLLYSYH